MPKTTESATDQSARGSNGSGMQLMLRWAALRWKSTHREGTKQVTSVPAARPHAKAYLNRCFSLMQKRLNS